MNKYAQCCLHKQYLQRCREQHITAGLCKRVRRYHKQQPKSIEITFKWKLWLGNLLLPKWKLFYNAA